MANRPTALAHTDFRLDSFFFGRPGAPVTVIDWQLTVRSVGAMDIGYFIVQSLTTVASVTTRGTMPKRTSTTR